MEQEQTQAVSCITSDLLNESVFHKHLSHEAGQALAQRVVEMLAALLG